MSYHFREMYLVNKVCFTFALSNNEMIKESRNSLKSDVSKLLKDATLMMLLPSQSDKQSLNVIPENLLFRRTSNRTKVPTIVLR